MWTRAISVHTCDIRCHQSFLHTQISCVCIVSCLIVSCFLFNFLFMDPLCRYFIVCQLYSLCISRSFNSKLHLTSCTLLMRCCTSFTKWVFPSKAKCLKGGWLMCYSKNFGLKQLCINLKLMYWRLI